MATSDSNPTMNREIARLIFGFRRFKERYFQQTTSAPSIYERLAKAGQMPKTMLIGCSDSRVDPAILTDAAPGELFIVRNVANLVPPCELHSEGFHGTSSALEFAVESLKVENVIVLGHRQCGGIQALVRGVTKNTNSFIGQWMSIAEEARDTIQSQHTHADEDTRCRLTEMESMKVSLRNLRSFPFVKKAIAERQMNVLAVYFDLEKGELWTFDETTEEFRQLDL